MRQLGEEGSMISSNVQNGKNFQIRQNQHCSSFGVQRGSASTNGVVELEYLWQAKVSNSQTRRKSSLEAAQRTSLPAKNVIGATAAL